MSSYLAWNWQRVFVTYSAWHQFIQRLDLRKRLDEKADVIVHLITKDVLGTESMATDNIS
jgi:sugar phosphate isomerase/epimerase